MLENLHVSLFLNLLGLALEVIGFVWILINELKCKNEQPNFLRPTKQLDDIMKLEDLERQAVNDLDDRVVTPIPVAYISDKILGTKRIGIQLIALGFFIQISSLFF
jgi:hypothetical protein